MLLCGGGGRGNFESGSSMLQGRGVDGGSESELYSSGMLVWRGVMGMGKARK